VRAALVSPVPEDVVDHLRRTRGDSTSACAPSLSRATTVALDPPTYLGHPHPVEMRGCGAIAIPTHPLTGPVAGRAGSGSKSEPPPPPLVKAGLFCPDRPQSLGSIDAEESRRQLSAMIRQGERPRLSERDLRD